MAVEYKGRVFRVETGSYDFKGKRRTFEKVVENDVVVMLALIGNDMVLERHYRPVIGKHIYELPAGHIENGEKPEHAARRELLEETGYDAKGCRLLFEAYPAVGTYTTKFYFYLMGQLTKKTATDNEESISSVKLFGVENLYKLISSKKMCDLKSIAGIMYYHDFLYKG